MDLVSRVQGILLKPKEEWIKIKGETTTFGELFTSYAMILAAIPAIAQFIGLGLVGRRIPFVGWFRLSIGRVLIYAVLTYISSLVLVYILGIVINALAPTFNSKQDMTGALKIAVFSMTAPWVAGILNIFPFLSPLVILASLYGLYLMYLGFAAPILETPKDKVMGYFVVSFVIGIVLQLVIALILGGLFFGGGVYRSL